ncbi:MAG: adenylosuccinate lyase [Candidatus Izemoplasmataceae bacterium]
MIERYRLKEMADLFTDDYKFKTYLRVELATLKAFSQLGKIPKEDVLKIETSAYVDIERIKALEAITKHDVIAFTRQISETLGDEKKWVHYGLTSTDVVDTALSCIYKEANTLIEEAIINFKETLKDLAYTYKATPCIGRTHGIHADITAFGLKFALYYDEFNRHHERFKTIRKRIEIGKISGAVGNFANTPPIVQDKVCSFLGIESANISTQTLQRDRHAEYIALLALIGSSLEKIAVEIRHLQRTEVKEVSEYFSKDQKGSSAMPHKKNPIASENISGAARVLRGYIIPAYESIALWHERDISHSSVERIIMPDALELLHYMLKRYNEVLKNLLVFEDQMLKNIYKTHGVIFSQRVMNALILQGLSREEAYDLVQPIAIKAYENQLDFKKLLTENETINRILKNDLLEESFTIDYYLKEVDTIFTRVFKEE